MGGGDEEIHLDQPAGLGNAHQRGSTGRGTSSGLARVLAAGLAALLWNVGVTALQPLYVPKPVIPAEAGIQEG